MKENIGQGEIENHLITNNVNVIVTLKFNIAYTQNIFVTYTFYFLLINLYKLLKKITLLMMSIFNITYKNHIQYTNGQVGK